MTNSETEEKPAPANRPVEFTAEDSAMLSGCRRQCDAKAALEKLLGKRVRPKTIRGSRCLFVGHETSTFYYGTTWGEAFLRAMIHIKRKAMSVEEQKLGLAADAAQREVPIS
jgi:hypothetical protein